MVVGQAVSIFFIFNYIPMSIFFTQRQWFLFKRFQIRNAMTEYEKNEFTASYNKSKFRFALLLWSTVILNIFYSICYGFYLYYALLIFPCNIDLTKCPDLRWLAFSILLLQIIIYINYMICCILLLVSMKRIHSTIKENFNHWNTNNCTITSHVIAFTCPIFMQIMVIALAEPWAVLQVNNEAVVHNTQVLVLKRDAQATFYFLLEITQAIIGMILLYIVVNYSIKRKELRTKE